MQQKLKFPVQYAQLSAEEQEQIGGGSPAWVGQLEEELKVFWQKAKPSILVAGVYITTFVNVVGAAAASYYYLKIINSSMKEMKRTLHWFRDQI